MKRHNQQKQPPLPLPPAPDMADKVIVALQDRLYSIEKKIDAIMNRMPEKPAAIRLAPQPGYRVDAPQTVHRVHQQQPSQEPPSRLQRPPEPKKEHHQPQRPMFQVICADCAKECEVPFKPTAGRPVYCRECYGKRRANGTHRPKPVGPAQESVKEKPAALPKTPAAHPPRPPASKRPSGHRKEGKKSKPQVKAKKGKR